MTEPTEAVEEALTPETAEEASFVQEDSALVDGARHEALDDPSDAEAQHIAQAEAFISKVAARQPITMTLDEGDRLLLEARETRLELARQRVVAKVEVAVALQRQQMLQQALAADPDVQATEVMLKFATNKVLDALEAMLPPGYAAVNLSWEKGQVQAAYHPEQRPKRH